MSLKQTTNKSKWALDFNVSKNTELDSPLGYNPATTINKTEVFRDQHLIMKRSWDLALGPWKQIPMNLFVMYMSGNSISIFPIMMLAMMLIRPLKAILSTLLTSKNANSTQDCGQKLVYFLGNLATVSLALYKCYSLGLLPTHASDWLAFVKPQNRLEYYGGGVTLT